MGKKKTPLVLAAGTTVVTKSGNTGTISGVIRHPVTRAMTAVVLGEGDEARVVSPSGLRRPEAENAA